MKFQAPRQSSHNVYLEIGILCFQSKLGFFDLLVLWIVLKGIDQHFLILHLVAEGNLVLVSPSSTHSDRRWPR